MSNNQVSLLNKKMSEMKETTIEKKTSYKVYIEDQSGNSYSTKLSDDILTINDAIVQAVKQFNHNIQANLPENPKYY